jgi:hypothetical protein
MVVTALSYCCKREVSCPAVEPAVVEVMREKEKESDDKRRSSIITSITIGRRLNGIRLADRLFFYIPRHLQ